MPIVEEKVLNGRIYVHQLGRGSQRAISIAQTQLRTSEKNGAYHRRKIGDVINYTRRSVTKVKFRHAM